MYEAIFYKVNDLGQFQKVERKTITNPMQRWYLPMEDTVDATFQGSKIQYPVTRNVEFVLVRKLEKKVYYVQKGEI